MCQVGFLLLSASAVFLLPTAPAAAQEEANSSDTSAEAASSETTATLRAIESFLRAQIAKREEADEIRKSIENAATEIDKTNLSEKLRVVTAEQTRLENQIVSLATGVPESELDPLEETFDLQDELEQLLRPFVWILKSATENAREIEHLKRTLLSASEDANQAEVALSRIKPLIDNAPAEGITVVRLQNILEDWETRRASALDKATLVQQQLRTRLEAKIDPSDAASRAFTSFFSDRGRNLLVGVIAFSLVILLLRLIRRTFVVLVGSPRNRSFPVRLFLLIFDFATIAMAFGTTITIFNYYNDWFLTGAMLLLLIAVGWFVLKSLPSLVEQVTLLLNLGAVQEGERLVIDNVPWRVTKLDLYSDLENPQLRGGQYTVPVRELRGKHSRPMDSNEPWFPCEEGDWVLLDNGLWAEVILQSPEAVQLREEGGAVSHLTTTAFLEENPKNLSHSYRATVEFGIDYQHQAEAADRIPQLMREFIDERLRNRFGRSNILKTYVTLFRAGSSSLDLEIEADVGPGMGQHYETIEHALSRLAVECCTENEWIIPFPQLTVHRQ